MATWNTIESLQPLFADAGSGKDAALGNLATALKEAETTEPLKKWPREIRDFWIEELETLLGKMDLDKIGEKHQAFADALLAIEYDHVTFRDLIAALARKQFSSYQDPAGMIKIIGFYPPNEASITALEKRLACFSLIEAGTFVSDPMRGLGQIVEVDSVINEVRIRFSHEDSFFPVGLVVDSYLLLKPGTELDLIVSGAQKWDASIDPDSFFETVETTIICSQDELPADAAKRFLVPKSLSETAYDEWAGSGEEDNIDQGPQRRWDEARGLAELCQLLGEQKVAPERPEGCEGIQEIMVSSAPRQDLAPQFAEALARLFASAATQDWLREIIEAVAEDAIVWNDEELFIQISDDLPGRLLPNWYRATIMARDPEFLAEMCMALPLRIWGHAEKIFAEKEETKTLLGDTVRKQVESNNTSADALLWLWRNGKEDRELLGNATLVFRTLAKNVRGSYLKANRDLRKLLQEKEEFQRLVMRNGTLEGIASLVRCTKSLPLLDAGSRQSLLVRIVRLYPEAISLVEERKETLARADIGLITSARSYEIRRRELEEIINVKIPENSRAIAAAREHGDLRENAEFKAAKEEQALLGARQTELQELLHNVKTTVFDDVTINNEVAPGCSVHLKTEKGRELVYHLLGLWDSDPDQNILSYDTPLGRVLLYASIGDEIELPSGEDAVITAIEKLSEELKAWVCVESIDNN